MRAVAILTIVALCGAVACLTLKESKERPRCGVTNGKPPGTNCWLPPALRKKMEEQKRMKELKEQEAKKAAEKSGFNFSSFLPIHKFNLSRWNISKPNHKWNPAGFRFEETVQKPSFIQRIKNHAKKLWAKRPWKKAAVKNTTEESSWNPAGHHIHHHWNHTNKTNHTNHTWNNKGYRFEETAPKTGFLHKIHHHAKRLWNMRPWKKATVKNTTEESSWNPAGHHIHHHWNHTNKTNHTNHTWNNKGYRFAEESNVFESVTNAVKKLWAKRPWKKTENKTEEASWNPAGVHFPTWNHTNKTNHTNHTWNNRGWRFEETAAPSVFDKIKNSLNGLWAKRPWKKAD